MWMVGYNEGGELSNNMADYYAFNGRKLRPLMPRPILTTTCPNNNHPSSSSATTTPPPPPPHCFSRIHASHDFFSQYHNITASSMAEQGKRDFNSPPAPPVVVSSRWNPTPEQLRALEELYRRGTRTPSAEQIQQITAQLRRYGKIEGKNVFYWFQNHKARERQKRRRQIESAAALDTIAAAAPLQKKDLGASRTVFEVEQTKNCWAPSTNCTTLAAAATTPAEESVSIQRAAKAAECRTDGWLQFDEPAEELQRRNFIERNATWHMMQLPCPIPPTTTTLVTPHYLINTTPPNNNNNASTTSMPTTASSVTAISSSLMDPKLIKTHHHDLSFFISPHHTHRSQNGVIHLSSSLIRSEHDNINTSVESQTLQLFPTRNVDGTADHNIINQQKETELSVQELNAPSQFFEFLPLKN